MRGGATPFVIEMPAFFGLGQGKGRMQRQDLMGQGARLAEEIGVDKQTWKSFFEENGEASDLWPRAMCFAMQIKPGKGESYIKAFSEAPGDKALEGLALVRNAMADWPAKAKTAAFKALFWEDAEALYEKFAPQTQEGWAGWAGEMAEQMGLGEGRMEKLWQLAAEKAGYGTGAGEALAWLCMENKEAAKGFLAACEKLCMKSDLCEYGMGFLAAVSNLGFEAAKGLADMDRMGPDIYSCRFLCSCQQDAQADKLGELFAGLCAKMPDGESPEFYSRWAGGLLAAARGVDDESDAENTNYRSANFGRVAQALAAAPWLEKAQGSGHFEEEFKEALESHLDVLMCEPEDASELRLGLAGAEALCKAAPGLFGGYREWLLETLEESPNTDEHKGEAMACETGIRLCNALGVSAYELLGIENWNRQDANSLMARLKDFSEQAAAPLRAALERGACARAAGGQAEPFLAAPVQAAQLCEFSKLALKMGSEPAEQFEKILGLMRQQVEAAEKQKGQGPEKEAPAGKRRQL